MGEGSSGERIRRRVVIGGRVQGVGYRYFAERWAGSLGIMGWVMNLPDGRVEVLAEGTRPAVEGFLERLREGPRLARVETFDVRDEPPTGELRDFRVVFSSR